MEAILDKKTKQMHTMYSLNQLRVAHVTALGAIVTMGWNCKDPHPIVPKGNSRKDQYNRQQSGHLHESVCFEIFAS